MSTESYTPSDPIWILKSEYEQYMLELGYAWLKDEEAHNHVWYESDVIDEGPDCG